MLQTRRFIEGVRSAILEEKYAHLKALTTLILYKDTRDEEKKECIRRLLVKKCEHEIINT